jgi:hypothetical protein
VGKLEVLGLVVYMNTGKGSITIHTQAPSTAIPCVGILTASLSNASA